MALACLVLAACGAPDPQRQPPPVQDTAFGDMVDAMDQARAVEDVTLQHKEALDQALEQAEGAGDP